ncbi:MAG: biotin carboxyl carrier protein [Candidatus Promineifilaceae bacterium]|jgi:biotin carboxyl carrier protein
MKFKININGIEQEINATKQGDQLTLTQPDGETLTAEIVRNAGGKIALSIDGQMLQIAGHKNGDNRQVWTNGRTLAYQRIDETATATMADPGSLSASIPAVVSEVLVAVGDSVSVGDRLILLESMKMIIPIVAPADGVVSEINCAAGDSVAPGVPLVVIGEPEN